MIFRTIDVGEVYIESNIMYSNTYTCAPRENPIQADPSNQIHEQQINYNALKLLARLSTFAGLLGQEILVDVGENTTLCDCDMSEKSGC